MTAKTANKTVANEIVETVTVETTNTPVLLNTTDIAKALDITPRALRTFLRSKAGMNARVGKGKRWAITPDQFTALRNAYVQRNTLPNTGDATESSENS